MSTKLFLDNVSLFYDMKKGVKITELLSNSYQLNNNYNTDNNNVEALKEIELSLKSGDRLGVVGRNGAGKSTLLKVMAGIYPPTKGAVDVKGRLATLFEFSTGFEMESTGYENIILRGVMLGETPKTMRLKMKEIAEFSELGNYLNFPVKTYSSGMFIRLAFSVSTSIRPDILLLDEVMAAGDAGFIKKAKERMNEMIDSVKILVFVSHSMESIKSFCNQAIWLDNGQIVEKGSPEKITQLYLNN